MSIEEQLKGFIKGNDIKYGICDICNKTKDCSVVHVEEIKTPFRVGDTILICPDCIKKHITKLHNGKTIMIYNDKLFNKNITGRFIESYLVER